MKNNNLKIILRVLSFFVLPFFILTVFGAVYIIAKIIVGIPFLASVGSFVQIVYSLIPYLSYMTTIPMIIIMVSMLLKHRGTVLPCAASACQLSLYLSKVYIPIRQ